MEQSFIKKIKRIKLSDIGHIFLCSAAFPCAWIYKKMRPHLWLLCEYENEARDNAYHLFKYLRTSQPKVDAVYAIRDHSPDAEKVRKLGKTVNYSSFKHWIYYLSAEKNISTQKGGKPNAAVCYLLEISFRVLKNNRYFLQHGITMNDLPYLYYQETFFKFFATAANPEHDFVCQKFGYPDGVVNKVGFCRYDALNDHQAIPGLIVIMPTWRQSLYFSCKNEKDFENSMYFKKWNELINDRRLGDLICKYSLRVIFCPHRNVTPYLGAFENGHAEITNWYSQDIEQLLKSAALLITDYSSLAIDCAYMHKPVIYYQFDYNDFRANHLAEGYFDYRADGFGPVCNQTDEMIAAIDHLAENNFVCDDQYIKKHHAFFSFIDSNNSQRTFEAINRL